MMSPFMQKDKCIYSRYYICILHKKAKQTNKQIQLLNHNDKSSIHMTFDIYFKSIHYPHLHINVGGVLFLLIILLYLFKRVKREQCE